MDEITTQSYTIYSAYMFPENLYTMQPLMSRPAGCAHLGMTPTLCTINLSHPHQNEKDILLDGGSAITIISRQCYENLESKPPLHKGKKILCRAVVGTTTMQYYTRIPLYFWSNQGPIELIVEAYINEEGTIDFILGNDWMHQYQINILRSPQDLVVTFGTTGRTCQARDSILPNKYEPWSFAVEEIQPEDNLCRLAESVTIPANTMQIVKVQFKIPEGLEQAYLKTAPCLLEGVTIQALPGILWEGKDQILIVNREPEEVHLEANLIMGKVGDPLDYISAPPTELQPTVLAAIEVMETLLSREIPTKPPPPDPNEPNIAELPGDPVPKEDLLKTIHINPELEEDKKQELIALLLEKQEAFGLDGRLGNPQVEFKITLKEGAKPTKTPMYHVNPKNREAGRKQFEEWLKKGIIRRLRPDEPTEWGFPVVYVWKDGKLRICIDYSKGLNQQTVKMNYPMMRITDIHRAMRGAKYISTLDALSGYNQIQVNEASQAYLAFDSHMGNSHSTNYPSG
jgi:hypothetical protein